MARRRRWACGKNRKAMYSFAFLLATTYMYLALQIPDDHDYYWSKRNPQIQFNSTQTKGDPGAQFVFKDKQTELELIIKKSPRENESSFTSKRNPQIQFNSTQTKGDPSAQFVFKDKQNDLESINKKSPRENESSVTSKRNPQIQFNSTQTKGDPSAQFVFKDKQNDLESIIKKFPREIESSFTSYNASVSISLGVFRQVPDVRFSDCRRITYNISQLPGASVIISFHNELWPVILRTINSILRNTPPRLLHEIILVDDCSTLAYLNTTLLEYVAALPKTKVIRNQERSGLIRTRMNGARLATGDVLIFLDAHIEVTPYWIEPLLDLIHKDPLVLAVPIVDALEPDTFRYRLTALNIGSFDWYFNYVWYSIPPRIKKLLNKTDPVPSPTNAGCAIAVDRTHFFSLGSFDEGMDIWGGENLEISFRYWMCAHGVYVLPCSRVGHLFRRSIPYKTRDSNVHYYQKNYQRAADVWMDQYAKFYYAATREKYEMTVEERQSLEKRKEMRQQWQCKSFEWYLTHVDPETFVPREDAEFQGQIKNIASGLCLTLDTLTGFFHIEDCGDRANQYFYYVNNSMLAINNTHCVAYSDLGWIQLAPCGHYSTFSYSWQIANGYPTNSQYRPQFPSHVVQIIHQSPTSALCIIHAMIAETNIGIAAMDTCKPDSEFHFWEITYKMDFSLH